MCYRRSPLPPSPREYCCRIFQEHTILPSGKQAMYIVAYDISDQQERHRVTKILYNYGERIQKSVWTCDMDSQTASRLQHLLAKLYIASGIIHIWQAKDTPWQTGNGVVKPRPWAHCL